MSVSRLSFDIPTATEGQDRFDLLSRREFLTVNGVGGYASGTLSGANTRRYHGYLVAMLPEPYGRMTLISKVEERVTCQGDTFELSANRYPNGTIHPQGYNHLHHFAPYPTPTWVYHLPGGTTLVKSIFLARERNTVYVHYSVPEAKDPVVLEMLPLMTWKTYHTEMHAFPGFPMRSEPLPDRSGWLFQAVWDAPRVMLTLETQQKAPYSFEPAHWWHDNVVHERERERGFDFHEDVFCPTVARVTIQPGRSVYLVATIEKETPQTGSVAYRETLRHLSAVLKTAKLDDEHSPVAQRSLALNADQFLIRTPDGRQTILAGYPWFTDWGRDTMISLSGLTLATGRKSVAREILRDFAAHVSEGMIPNRFPDANATPEYNTVDATLWFVHACDRYARVGRDRAFREELLPTLVTILQTHRTGTRFGIRMDPQDGLLSADDPGGNLTWMDARVAGISVTPRAGKAVEINALWINALLIVAEWSPKEAARPYRDLAALAGASFVERFVRADGRGLYDGIRPDGKPDPTVRPNQVLAAALPRIGLSPDVLVAVLKVATEELLTPFGLRTLSPADPAYRGRYQGGPNERDSSYHQGTVWPWLLGAYLDLFRRVHGANANVSELTAPLLGHLEEYGVGGLAEVFDGDAPHHPNGCPWQAWSVAELLRSLAGAGSAEGAEVG
ncbi:MAG: amylo-alpha-1,6-glucosidase [Capsulimonadales bacterium]|nr:amylo-alpha-1,6-glucosidase [Capsulimonadales bacterium]